MSVNRIIILTGSVNYLGYFGDKQGKSPSGFDSGKLGGITVEVPVRLSRLHLACGICLGR